MTDPSDPELRPAPRRRRGRPRGLRLAAWLAGGVLIGVGLAFLALNVVARTRMGHERVLSLTLRALGGSIKGGTLNIERASGNLFEGARLYRLALRDTAGRPFILADSAFADYDVRTLLSPRIEISRLTLYNPRIWITMYPGDSLWNYQSIFRDTVPADPLRPSVERVVLADTVRVVGGFVRVESPWVADSTLSERGQRRMEREAVADTSPIVVRRVAGGFVRQLNVGRLNGQLSGVRFAPGSENGSRFRIDALRGVVQFYRDTFALREGRGDVALFNDRVEFDAPRLRVNSTPLSASGAIHFDREPNPAYDVAFRSDSLAFRDLRWLYPRFPADARGSLQMLIETRPGTTRFDVRDAVIRAPGTRIAGRFGMVWGPDTLLFTGVDVRADPVRVSLIEQMLPEGLPVRGLVLGGAVIQGSGRTSRQAIARDSTR